MDKHHFLYGDADESGPGKLEPEIVRRNARIESDRLSAAKIKGEQAFDYNRRDNIYGEWGRDQRDQTPLALYFARLKDSVFK